MAEPIACRLSRDLINPTPCLNRSFASFVSFHCDRLTGKVTRYGRAASWVALTASVEQGGLIWPFSLDQHLGDHSIGPCLVRPAKKERLAQSEILALDKIG